MQHDRRTPNRLSPTFLQVVNPIWWASDTERNPKWSWWKWFKRNPFYNFTSVIIGVSDCHRTVYYSKSPWTFAESGWNYGYTLIDHWTVPLPRISNRGFYGPSFRLWRYYIPYITIERMEFCIGWKTSGVASMTYRRANSPNAGDTP